MNWTDLQKNWVPLSEPDKFKKYAKESRIHKPEVREKETWFEPDRAAFYDNIMEYNFTTIPNIEKEIARIADFTGLKNKEIAAKITAVTMMKMQPREVSARERFGVKTGTAGFERYKQEKPIKFIEGHSRPVNLANNGDDAPPDFWYPM